MTMEQAKFVIGMIKSDRIPEHWDWFNDLFLRARNIILQGEKCEECDLHGRDVFRRAEHGKVVCSGCHHDIMRTNTPSKFFRRLTA